MARLTLHSEGDEGQTGSTTVNSSDRPITPLGTGSDGENERTTRERLKQTSIAGLSQQASNSVSAATGQETLGESLAPDTAIIQNGNGRGRPSKKRSLEDMKDDQASPANGSAEFKRGAAHKRMRSREVGHDGEVALDYENAGSPVEEETDADAQDAPGGPGVIIDADVAEDANAPQTAPTVEEKILQEEDTTNEPTTGVGAETGLPSTSAEQTKADTTPQSVSGAASKSTVSPGSGFANTSSSSPFGAVKSTSPQSSDTKATSTTSPSAFASSGLAAFASQEKSPFGAAGSTTSTGGFGSGSAGFGGGSTGFGSGGSGGFVKAKSPFGGGGGFGGGAPPSSFGSQPSPFGGSSTGFGRPAGAFSSDKGFGGGAAPKPFGGAPARFGKIKSDDEEEGESEGEDEQSKEQPEEERQDSRFQKQDVETGEEGEETIFSARAKLYQFDSKEWKERGTGVIKVNVRQEAATTTTTTAKNEPPEQQDDDLEAGNNDEEDDNIELKARVIMRSDGVHRVILNTPVFKDMKVGSQDGEEPTGKTMFLTGMDEGKPRLFQIKMGKEDTLRELYYRISEFKGGL